MLGFKDWSVEVDKIARVIVLTHKEGMQEIIPIKQIKFDEEIYVVMGLVSKCIEDAESKRRIEVVSVLARKIMQEIAD